MAGPEFTDPRDDLPGTIRRLPNGALLVRRDVTKRTGAMRLAVLRDGAPGVESALYDHEVDGSRVVGAMPGTPAVNDPRRDFRPHLHDCAPCDAARAVVAEIAVVLDPLDNWPDHGVTERLTATTAETLHNFPIGGRRA